MSLLPPAALGIIVQEIFDYMMDHMTYSSKSPEKSSPSFPEDVEDDEDDPIGLNHHLKYSNNSKSNNNVNSNNTILEQHQRSEENDAQIDVTMLPEDEDDDMVPTRSSYLLNVDSPHHPTTDSSEKKVHWSNQNVQILLDCVEKHLDEFNIQKKHKQVWQTIGTEMESLGFTMEHCYNKWKNLRRDVRILVNNPQKAVRNADILRRVARLILVIYPNIDATTMQVSGDRISGNGGGKSTPSTPVGHLNNNLPNKINLATSLHAPDSPLYYGINGRICKTPNPLTPNFHTFTSNGIKHKNEHLMYDSPVPGTVLFTNSRHENEKPVVSNNLNNASTTANNNTTTGNTNTTSNTNTTNNIADTINTTNQNTGFPFFFNPAAAALLVQSQLFNDLLRQQHQSQTHNDDSSQLDSVQQRDQLFSNDLNSKSSLNSFLNSNLCTSNLTNGEHDAVSLATTILNGLGTATTDLSHYSNLLLSAESILNGNNNNNSSLTDRLPPGSELAGVVERLRNEETVHMRLTDMVTHLADELRAAGMRRRATLDQLLEIMQGARLPSAINTNPKTNDTSHRV